VADGAKRRRFVTNAEGETRTWDQPALEQPTFVTNSRGETLDWKALQAEGAKRAENERRDRQEQLQRQQADIERRRVESARHERGAHGQRQQLDQRQLRNRRQLETVVRRSTQRRRPAWPIFEWALGPLAQLFEHLKSESKTWMPLLIVCGLAVALALAVVYLVR
jgi:hypothetical protein